MMEQQQSVHSINERHKDNLIVSLTFEFSLDIINYTERLTVLKKYNLSNQLFHSGTSIGANVREAQNSESKADFIHKLKIAMKEVEETEYWLLLCKHAPTYPEPAELLNKVTSITNVLNKIIATSKRT